MIQKINRCQQSAHQSTLLQTYLCLAGELSFGQHSDTLPDNNCQLGPNYMTNTLVEFFQCFLEVNNVPALGNLNITIKMTVFWSIWIILPLFI